MVDRWHYIESGKQRGPITLEELKGLFISGSLGPQSEVWREGTPDFRRALQVEELSDLFPATTGSDRDEGIGAASTHVASTSNETWNAPAPADDSGFPRPLTDPLRTFSRFVGILNLAIIASFLCYLLIVWQRSGRLLPGGWVMELVPVPFIIAMPFLLWLWCILPHRSVNAVYLRSFWNDSQTGRIRSIVQAALGRGFRLGGIRSPRRRWPLVLRMIDVFLFAIRYSSPRYMNLEAGPDWKERLWSTMRNVRCAIIDAANPTAFVEEEIELSGVALGFDRTLFIGDTSRSPDEWRESVARSSMHWAEYIVKDKVKVAIWDDSPAGRKAFAESVRAFKSSLPAGTAGNEIPGRQLAQNSTGSTANEETSWRKAAWIQVVFGLALSIFLNCGGMNLLLAGSPVSLLSMGMILLWNTFCIGYFLAQLIFLFQYFREAASPLKSILRIITFLPVIAIPYGILIPAVINVREAANRMEIANNLKIIGLGMHSYNDRYRGLPPPAITDQAGKPLLSWRVAILPFIDQEPLYRQFKLDEPWDSRHNIRLISQMPGIYALPGVTTKEPGRTFYQVLVGPGTPFEAFGPRPFINGPKGNIPFSAIRDGTSNTIMVVEVAEPVIWTKPGDLPFDQKGPLPKLGRMSKHGFLVVLCDGSIRFISSTISDQTLRALITRNGGEVINDPDF